MPIRFKEISVSRRAQLVATLDGASSQLSGTHVAPAGRTGVLSPQLSGATANIQGLFAPSVTRTGQIASVLNGASASLAGTFTPAGVGGSSFTPDAGFTVTTPTNFSHGQLMRIQRSSGSFGTHGNFNPHANKWQGNTYRNAVFLDFEDGVMEKRDVGYDLDDSVGGQVSDNWQLSNNAPANLTRSARRFYGTQEQGGLQYLPSSNATRAYFSAKFLLEPNRQAGKFIRPYMGSSVDIYNSTGCDNVFWRAISEGFPGGDFVKNPTNFTGAPFTPGAFNHIEMWCDCAANAWYCLIDGQRADGTSLGEVQFPSSFSTQHTIDIGHMVDHPNDPERCANLGWNAGELWADYIVDFAFGQIMIADSTTWAARTKWEYCPLVTETSTTDWTVAINRGELSSVPGSYAYFRTMSFSGSTVNESVERIGRF